MSYLKKYEYVIALAESKSISQAAERLGISQPTFSKYLKKIEVELGVELFDRSTVPLRLTRAGENFVLAGKKFIDLDRQLSKQIEEYKSEEGAQIRVGISPSRSTYMMPDILRRYLELRPGARVHIEERTTKELNKHLTEGELDIVISLLDSETEGFERIELFDERLLLAVPVSVDCDSVEQILASSTLISVGKGQFMWHAIESVMENLGVRSPQIECQSIVSALALVKKGVGVMIAPSYCADKSDESVKFLPLEINKSIKRRVCVFYRREQFLTQSERDFINCIIKSTKED